MMVNLVDGKELAMGDKSPKKETKKPKKEKSGAKAAAK
jgi:hypothetical protein